MVRLKIGICTKVPDVLASLAAASDFATFLEGVCHFALILATCLVPLALTLGLPMALILATCLAIAFKVA